MAPSKKAPAKPVKSASRKAAAPRSAKPAKAPAKAPARKTAAARQPGAKASPKATARTPAAKTPAKAPAKAAAKSIPARKTAPPSRPAPAAPSSSAPKGIKAVATVRKPAPGRPGDAGTTRPTPPPASRRALRSALEPAETSGPIHGIPPYQPAPGENYMSERQLEHFRQILLAWKRELMEEVDRTVHHMQDEASNFPDPNDRATQESEFGLELRTRDRERKLLKKIDSALARIEDGSYGYCEETGEEIGLKRLEARPVATLCLEAQERREMAEKQYGEREDLYR